MKLAPLLALALLGCRPGYERVAGSFAAVTRVRITAPSDRVVIGDTMVVAATALDAYGMPVNATGFMFSSSNPARFPVTADGVVSTIFDPSAEPRGFIRVELVRGNVTLRDSVEIGFRAPEFQFAALLLPELVRPTPVASQGVAVAFFNVHDATVDYTIAWSGFDGPATSFFMRGPAAEDEIGDGMIAFLPPHIEENYGSMKGSFIVGQIRPNGGTRLTLDSLITLFTNSRAYIEARTTEHHGGEARGAVEGLLQPSPRTHEPTNPRTHEPTNPRTHEPTNPRTHANAIARR